MKRRFLAAVAVIGMLFMVGCIPIRNSGTTHYLVIGIGVVSVNNTNQAVAQVTKANILGGYVSERGAGVGYSAMTRIEVNTNSDMSIEVSSVPFHQVIVKINKNSNENFRSVGTSNDVSRLQVQSEPNRIINRNDARIRCFPIASGVIPPSNIGIQTNRICDGTLHHEWNCPRCPDGLRFQDFNLYFWRRYSFSHCNGRTCDDSIACGIDDVS